MITKNDKPTDEILGFVEEEDGSLKIDDITIPPPPVATLSHDVPDKRLIITELRIKNFKSYANEVVLGPFDNNFTAVVGPNGSGKSNVIDSLLFVFGYRSKKIRSKKVSLLIHKSDSFPNLTSCTVTVKFAMIKETAEDYEIIPKTTFTLSRTAFHDDSTHYEMDGKRAKYKDVAKALRQYGIDLEHSRFLILQGEIEAISLMNPKAQNEHESGMLEYVEDIIGTNRYIEPIQKFNEKLEKLNEEKKEKLNNLKLVEKEKDDLEEPKNKAVEYLRLENQMIKSENSLLHCKRFIAEKELEEILTVKQTAVQKLNELKAQINDLKSTRKTQEDEMEKISSELDTNMKNFEKFKDACKSLERKDVEMLEEIKHLTTKKSKFESTLSSTQTEQEMFHGCPWELAKQKKQLETHEKETNELTKMKEKLESNKNIEDKKLSEVMDTMQNQTTILQEKKDKLESSLLKMKKEVHNVQSEKELLQSELNILMRTDAKEKQTLTNMVTSHEDAKKRAKEEEILLKNEEKRNVDLQAEYEKIMQEISASQKKEESSLDQLKNARLKFEEAKTSLSAYKTRSGVMQAFNKEKAQGKFQGIYGRLGDLGAIDEKYDVAISTAAPNLDNILTDNMETAQQCVNFLKKNNLGYCTFIALDKQQRWWPNVRRQYQAPENVPRLIDLIRVNDENLLPGFYHALGDTLVANDLDQATRIGLQGEKRHRVVTLKGELIETSGTMSGGGGRVSRGRMGQTVVECTHTPEDVKAIGQEVDILTKSVSEIRKSILELQERVSKITKERAGLKVSVKKRQVNFKAYLDNAEMLNTQIEEQRKKVKNSVVDEKKVADLKSRIMVKEKCYNEKAEEASAVEEKVSKLQDEILKITKGSMSKVAKSVEQLTKKISEVSQSITKSVVHAKNCRKNIKKNEEKLKNLEKEYACIDETKTKLEAERKKYENQAIEYRDKQGAAQAAVENLKGKKAELKKVLETHHDKEHQLKLDEINQKNSLKEHEANESEKRSAIRSYTAKIAKLKLNEVENDPTDIPTLTVEQIEKLSLKRLHSDIDLLKVQLEEMKPDLSAIAEYKKKEKLCMEKQKDLDNIVQERNLQNMRYEELRKRRLTEFMKGFTAIAKKLKEIYQMLTLGGDAELELVDSFDPFSKGIDFSVRPPRKSWKFMRNLSGGEKTLSSLSLVFALHYYRPTPFYVMDEIDAALDVRNVAIVGFFLKQRQRNTQFIIVSLRNIMNELSDHLIGIYKTHNTSKNVSIKGAARWKEDEALETPQSKNRKSK